VSIFDYIQKFPPGPYGTNEGDIWSGEDSEIGRRLKADGLVMIHEVFRNEETGVCEEKIYNVAENNPDPAMQGFIKAAREGVAKWVEAQAKAN